MCVRVGSRLPEAAAISLINSNFWRNKVSGEQGEGDDDDGSSMCVYVCPPSCKCACTELAGFS